VTQVSIADVNDVRARIARAHERAAAEFRDTFILGTTPPTRHLEILASHLIAEARAVRVIGEPFTIEEGRIVPQHENFDVGPDALFEYWMIISEIAGSTAWRMTRVVATPDEYDEALRRMKSPQIVRALVGSFLPSYERASLEVTLYTRAVEERVERRMLTLDASNEFHFHSRELIAEGRGGVPV
jgi:hypothetical protein